jgi:hypothetical protein
MIRVEGASDDLIEIGGDISEEFYLQNDKGDLLAFSDGTVLRIEFGDPWRITPIVRGNAALTILLAAEHDDEGTDVATLDGDIAWVVHGVNHAVKKT